MISESTTLTEGTKYIPGFDFSNIDGKDPNATLIDYDAILEEWLVVFPSKEHSHVYSETQQVLGSILGAKWDKDIKGWRYPATASVLTEIITRISREREYYKKYIKDEDNLGHGYYDERFRLYKVIELTDLAKAISESIRNLEERWMKLKSEFTTTAPELARPVGVELMPHQHNAVEFILSHTACLLGDDMGTGKTLDALLCATYWHLKKEINHVLVVCPNTAKDVWVYQSNLFYPNKFIPILITGGMTFEERVKELTVFSPSDKNKIPLYIINYESARMHPVELQKICDNGLLILDEVHKVKSPKSIITKVLLGSPDSPGLKAKYILPMTGTAIVNKPEDAWSIFQLIKPGLLGRSMDEFSRFFMRFDRHSRRVTYVNLDDLNKRIQPFYIRRTKLEVMKDLPEKIIRPIYSTIEGQQYEVYKEMALKFRTQLLDMEDGVYTTSAVNIVSQILRLMQICDGFLQDKAPSAHWIKEVSKIAQLKEILEDASVIGDGKKAVIWSRFIPPIELLKLELMDLNPAVLHGGVPFSKRGSGPGSGEDTEVGRFWKHDDCKVLIGQIHTGGLGIDLSNANLCVFYDYWWSPGINSQAEDRLHRKGQKNSVDVVYLLTKLPGNSNTIESMYYERLLEKKSWIKTAWEGKEAFLPTRDELIDWLGKVI
jgi:SNF2 family DNA or RNA helicase